LSRQDEVDYTYVAKSIRPRIHPVRKIDLERYIRRHSPRKTNCTIPEDLWLELKHGGFVDDCNAGLFTLERLINVLRGKARRQLERRKAIQEGSEWTQWA
jgi:hypothetical protein